MSTEAGAPDELAVLQQRWDAALGEITRGDMRRAGRLLTDRLLDAGSVDEHTDARRTHRQLVRHAERVRGLLQDLLDRIDTLRVDWEAARRYTVAGLDDLCEELRDGFALDGAEGARRWLREVLFALEAAEGHAAERLARLDLPLGEDGRAAAGDLVAGIRAWNAGDVERGLGLCRDLASGALTGRLGVTDKAVRVRAHRIAAWLCLELLADPEGARAELDHAVRLGPASARARAERAALFLRLGDVDRAISDAHRAVEANPGGATGHLVLGACAEEANDLAGADQLYRTGLERMSAYQLATAGRRVSLLEPTGRMLLRVAERLAGLDRPDSALAVLEEALRRPIADTRPYSHVDAHRLRSVVLERLGERPAAALAALEAGKRDLWNHDEARAVEQLERAAHLDASIPRTGWYLADALVSLAVARDASAPDRALVERAQHVWDVNRDRFGWPAGATSWAYSTRATIVEQLHAASPAWSQAAWEALFLVERGIVHELVDPTFADGGRWAAAARYLRALRLEELALECADRADALGTFSYEALSERVLLLAHTGHLREVEPVARRLESAYGAMPWLRAVRAVAAVREGRFAAALEQLPGTPSEEDGYPLTWFHSLRALCHLGVGDLAAARAAYAAVLLAVPHTAVDFCDLAVAAAALGDVEPARRHLDRAQGEAPEDQVHGAALFVALAAGDVDEAVRRLLQALDRAHSAQELDDVLAEVRLRSRVLDGPAGPAFEQRLDGDVAGRVAELRARLAAHPPTAAARLAAAIADAERDPPAPTAPCTLLAIRARRLVEGDTGEAAADVYESLLGSPFGPEAQIGLCKALELASDYHAARGDVERVRRLQARLAAHGATDADAIALAVATALVASGRRPEALAELEAAVGDTPDPERRRRLHERIAVVALGVPDARCADRHLAEAIALAVAGGDLAATARLEVRRAIAKAIARDFDGAVEHLRAALTAWEAAGAFDPMASMRQEVRLAVEDSVAPGLAAVMRGALPTVLRRLLGLADAHAAEAPGSPARP